MTPHEMAIREQAAALLTREAEVLRQRAADRTFPADQWLRTIAAGKLRVARWLLSRGERSK